MDFAVRDTPEQIAFRNEVRDWLKANIPAEITDTLHPDPNEVTEEQFTWGKQFRQKLGQKGWLAPTWPTGRSRFRNSSRVFRMPVRAKL